MDASVCVIKVAKTVNVNGKAIATAPSHAMQVFNDLHYSNRCRVFFGFYKGYY